MRTLLFTGKGGVGKTTVAAATALRCARDGARTLVISTDPAHSLADAFDRPLGPEPTPLGGTLHGQQLDGRLRLEESWGEIRDYLLEVFAWAGVDEVEAEELAVLPGLDELFALMDINRYAQSGEWDVLVVDCAPTAETLRLLSLPGILEWYMERVLPVGRRVNRMVAPVLAKVTTLPLADDEVFGATYRLYRRLEGVKSVLADADRTSIRLVVNPERMVIAEARRTYTYLSLFGYRVDAVVANRLLPAGADDPWLARWRGIQAGHLDEIEQSFAPLPVLRGPWADDEPVGDDRLAALADALYGDRDPAALLHAGEPFTIAREGNRWIVRIELPFAEKGEVEVARRADELLVSIGPYRRSVVLPESLRRRSVTSAQLRDGVLRVTFADPVGPTVLRPPGGSSSRQAGGGDRTRPARAPRS